MSRRSRRAEAARQAAAEKDFVHTAADRVGPLAQSAAERIGPLAEAAADAIGSAADKVSPLAHSAADRVGPLAQNAASRVGPLAQTAADRVSPYARVAAERVSPYTATAAEYAQTAAGRLAPLAASARLRGTQVTEDARRRISPVLDDAVDRISPVVGSAREKVTGELLPRLSDVLSVAAIGKAVEEVAEEPAPKKKRRWVKRLAVIGALGAVIAVVARRFLGSSDADWQAARPTAPYVPPTTPAPAPTETAADTVGDAGVAAETTSDDLSGASSAPVETAATNGSSVLDQPAEGGADDQPAPAAEEDFAATEPAPVGLLSVDDAGNVEETVVDHVVVSEPVPDLPEGEPVSDSPVADERPPRWSGEGVYVGHEPPEGFVIKGNERSKKYHVPESAGYGRTVAEVWFNSEEAAQQAGFVRAQR